MHSDGNTPAQQDKAPEPTVGPWSQGQPRDSAFRVLSTEISHQLGNIYSKKIYIYIFPLA